MGVEGEGGGGGRRRSQPCPPGCGGCGGLPGLVELQEIAQEASWTALTYIQISCSLIRKSFAHQHLSLYISFCTTIILLVPVDWTRSTRESASYDL